MRNAPSPAAPGRLPLEALVACPNCDALSRTADVGPHEQAACPRCGTVLVAPARHSFVHVIALALTAAILMTGAVFLPFLKVSAREFSHETSIFGAAMAFSDGLMLPLSVAVLITIVALPVLRLAAILYAVWPLAAGRPPLPHAARMFRVAGELAPWSMAEIFVIGTGVALVKVAGLAQVTFGAAFWALCLLLLVTALKNSFLSEGAIWAALGRAR